MKLASYVVRTGRRTSFGIVTATGLIDLGRHFAGRFDDIKSVLAAGALGELRELAARADDLRADEVMFRPVIERPDKIFCVGMNYQDKRVEFNATDSAPTLFVRFPDSQTGHGCAVLKPAMTQEFDYEGELAVVIGREGSHIRREDADAYIAGYSCYMDGSVRDWQHSWFTAGKNWPQTGSFGPWLVTRDEIGDPHQLGIRTYVNGMKVQDDNTRNMIHSIPSLIEYISTFSALSPGDVIITGSPGGVGKKRTPPLFLKDGDTVSVEIDRIGTLRNPIVQGEAAAA
ncbi:fumarylacetoacetate hydrolase family protein [Uliginosibacterium sp. sgz301328]|uniref:fumarylacetoacetate hydrolase family protein n=1 Tax=Uliginosibacterium sp. sgz301328 TaxID=3243764 RepID=UPI00359E3B92